MFAMTHMASAIELDIPANHELRKQLTYGTRRNFLAQWATTASQSVGKTLTTPEPCEPVYWKKGVTNDPTTFEQRGITPFMIHQRLAVDVPLH